MHSYLLCAVVLSEVFHNVVLRFVLVDIVHFLSHLVVIFLKCWHRPQKIAGPQDVVLILYYHEQLAH